MKLTIKESKNFAVGYDAERISLSAFNDALCDILTKVGEDAVKEARENGSYQDRTGNLRSSIGYVVLRNGRVVSQSASAQFDGPAGQGAEGVAAGRNLLSRIARDYPSGIALVVVAGMSYAVYVEDYRGKNVLSSSRQKALAQVPALLKAVGFDVM